MMDFFIDYGYFEYFLFVLWKIFIMVWLVEDIFFFDVGGFVVGFDFCIVILWGKFFGILVGVFFFNEVFIQCGCMVEWYVCEGFYVEMYGGKKVLVIVMGFVYGFLEGECVVLNIFVWCLGVVIMSRWLLVNLWSVGYKGILVGMRKMMLGFRLVEKYGMLVGGVDIYRMDLSIMMMLKDNYVWSWGSIMQVVKVVKVVGGFSLKVEVEVQSEEEVDEVIRVGVDVIMLDNFIGEGVKVVVWSLRERWKGEREFLLEVLGGLMEDNVESYICNGEFFLGCEGDGYLLMVVKNRY